MVKLGFIVEGDSEKIILEKSDFFAYLSSLSIEYIPDVINARGNDNLLPHNILPLIQSLVDKGANKIFILTDLDENKCITLTKERISPLVDQQVIVSRKQVESWFLADTRAINQLFKDANYYCDDPEGIANPSEHIKQERLNRARRGIGTKTILANTMMGCGFSIQRAAEHPNCTSAKYFINKIKEVKGK